MSRKPNPRKDQGKAAFTLVELILVAAIIMIMMGLLAVSLTQTQGRSLQMASAQVASGMSMARQLAITKNTTALFLVANRSGKAVGDFYPQEAFRYWAVVYSNRDQNSWTLAKDWEPLPSGTVFMGLAGEGYNTINWNTKNGTLPAVGEAFAPDTRASTTGDWRIFNSFTNLAVSWPGGTANLQKIPFIGFKPSGAGFVLKTTKAPIAPRAMAVILSEGAAAEGDKILLRSTNNITHVETEYRVGRVLVRARDSYR